MLFSDHQTTKSGCELEVKDSFRLSFSMVKAPVGGSSANMFDFTMVALMVPKYVSLWFIYSSKSLAKK